MHACHYCRDLVEREGWVKTRLAGLSLGGTPASDRLKDALMGAQAGLTPGDALLALSTKPRRGSLVAIGGGAAGAAVLGVLALGAAPANAPAIDRRVPATNVPQPGVVTLHAAPERRPDAPAAAPAEAALACLCEDRTVSDRPEQPSDQEDTAPLPGLPRSRSPFEPPRARAGRRLVGPADDAAAAAVAEP